MAKKQATPSMPFNPLDFVETEDRSAEEARYEGPPRTWYSVDPDRLYPAMIELIRAGAKPTDRSQVVDGELVKDLDAEKYRGDLARVRVSYAKHLDDALLPLVEQDDGPPLPPAMALDQHRRAIRADILETARLWFTNELARAVGKPIGLHILKSVRWKL
jgi:hypothetical protein